MENLKDKNNFFSSVSEITNVFYKNKFQKYINKNFKILDFGCGSGELLNLINCKYKIGVEINKFSQKKLKKKKLNFVSYIDKIKGVKFDTIFALSVIDHIEYPTIFLKKLKSKLKKNGHLIVIIRYDGKNQNLQNSFYKEHLYSWSKLSFSNLISKVGLKVYRTGNIKITLPPKFYFLKQYFGIKFILTLSKIYYYFNFKDKRFYFICKKK